MSCYLAPMPNLPEPSHETSSFEHWQQTFSRGQLSGPSVEYWSSPERPPRQGSTQVERITLLGESFSAIRESIRDSEAGSPHSASPRRFRSPTGNAGIHEILFAQQSRLGTVVGAGEGPPSTYF